MKKITLKTNTDCLHVLAQSIKRELTVDASKKDFNRKLYLAVLVPTMQRMERRTVLNDYGISKCRFSLSMSESIAFFCLFNPQEDFPAFQYALIKAICKDIHQTYLV